jgi:uncharacterized protein
MTSPVAVIASGHMVDQPDRSTPRFPQEQVPRVRAEVAATLREWRVGPGTTVVTGGARGADLIVAEEASVLGARVVLCLALPAAELRARSVDLPGTDWGERFDRMLAVAEVHAPDPGASHNGSDAFAQANERIVAIATALEPAPHAIVVWNGGVGDGAGGTLDLVRRLGFDGPNPRIRVVDPTPRRYEARQRAAGPKRMLSLDGGGLRGVLSLEILAAIERQLRDRYGRPDLVLSDYFDHFAGTSTGAIIATALALGTSVDELRRRYEKLAMLVFTKRFLPFRFRSLYVDRPLRRELGEFFGTDRRLGDPDMRALLLIVMHNTVTDSPWVLSNCTQARYNRADRNLHTPPDRNLDIELVRLVRASTAAPVFFPPEELQVGRHRFLFQDGGITPFNNPALLQFLLATIPEYGLGWPVGEDRLLIVSVGTGSYAAIHPGLRGGRVHLAFNARNLPAVFMNGSAVSQDLLCRSFGRCRFGGPLDREVGARTAPEATGVGGQNMFTYLRYDADLSDEALAEVGITDRRGRQRVRKLDAVDQVPVLQRIGRQVATRVDLGTHFEGFLESRDEHSRTGDGA